MIVINLGTLNRAPSYMHRLFLLLITLSALMHAEKKKGGLPICASESVANNYQIMKLSDELFRAAGIKYWADGGTLIGSLRHRGFIPWDMELDVDIHIEDEEKFLDLAPFFKRYRCVITATESNGLQRSYRVKRYDKKGNPLFGHLDVFCVHYSEENARYEFYGNWYWDSEEIEYTVRAPFGPIDIELPVGGMNYITRHYGPSVMSEGKIMCHGTSFDSTIVTAFADAKYRVKDSSILLNRDPLPIFDEVVDFFAERERVNR